MVGLHYITLPMLAQIGKRALEARERLHLLTGEAAGEQFEMPDREDPSLLLHDVLVAIPVAEPRRTKRDESQAWLHALEQQIDPDRAPGWMAAELKVRGVKVKRQMNRSRMQDGERVQDNYPGVETGEIRRALEAMDVAEEALQGGESRSAHDAHLASISPSNAA